MVVWVLRYGHRIFRDQRATTHVILTARALGAKKVIVSGDKDHKLIERIEKINLQWGSDFKIEYIKNWISFVEEFKKKGGRFVHLTMYGDQIREKIEEIRADSVDCLVFVGSQKVPPEAYKLSDFNIAVTTQPHSEIAALAIFLDQYFHQRELEVTWPVKKDGKK